MVDTSVGTEISSISPSGEIERSKKELKFSYSTAAYDSYAKEGFVPPDIFHRPDKFEDRFLSAVDPAKGKVRVKITTMVRLMAVDYSSENLETKEFLYWISEWRAKNWLGAEIDPVEHIEGKYKEQTKKRVLGDFDSKTGVQAAYYVKDLPRTVYSIPFTKTKVDEILEGKHPFGPDSINITEPTQVMFYGKFSGILGVQAFRCADYTYQQFVVPEWKRFVELAIREGGPAGKEQNNFPIFIR